MLQGLEQERSQLLTEAEYKAAREEILEELAHGPRVRLFTVFTFAALGLLLLGFGVLVLVRWRVEPSAGYGPVLVAIGAAAVWAYVMVGYRRSLSEELSRPLSQRLAQLEELKTRNLVSDDEYRQILTGILNSKQRG